MGMSRDDEEREKDKAWANLCLDTGWVCRLCDAIPKRGKRFENDLCDDCRLLTKNE
jgi:hypothetical protein